MRQSFWVSILNSPPELIMALFLILPKLLLALWAFDFVIEKQTARHVSPAVRALHGIRAQGKIIFHKLIK